ncbi:substrate-binding periplasmic protein [Marinomonas sp. PE14-40]|uniref:substrate-binding periplasmic protein n=1 Tax=Marinomonas sp. PE14-40 TaxID=3060621 RepID=UPI003F67D6DE
MNKKQIRVLTFLIIFAGFQAINLNAETVRLTSGEWAPFTSEHTLKHNGLVSRIIRDSFALEGINVEFGYFPWKRSLRLAREGRWDGSVGWAITRPDIQEDFYISDATNSIPKVLFSLKEKPLIWDSMVDLEDKQIGVTDGYFYGSMFENAKNNERFKVQYVSSERLNLIKLLGGRMDAVAMGLDAGLYMIKRDLSPDQADRITYHPRLLAETFQGVVFPKKLERSARLVKTFNKGLKRLKASGKYDQYFAESRAGLYLLEN